MNNSTFNINSQNQKNFSASIISTFLKGSTMLDSNKSDSNLDPRLNLSIYNAFTGMKIIAPFNIFDSMDSFKVYIAQILKIDVERLFLLSPLGIKLKFSMIKNEQINEVFAFDRKFFNPILVKKEKSDIIVKELLTTLNQSDHELVIKPRESPILASNINNFITKIDNLTNKRNNDKTSNGKNDEIIVNSTDLDFDSLRLLLNLMKRNSGWSSALLSDMKSALYNNVYFHDYEIVENIIKAFNSLIQYISNLFSNLEKEFNSVLDNFSNLRNNSLADKWGKCFKLLEKITFSYTDKKTKQLRTLILSDLIDLDNTSTCSDKSKLLVKQINKYFIELRSLIENDIVNQKEKIVNDYESYKTLYLKPQWETSERETIDESKEIYRQLEILVAEMVKNKLPSFEELITTSDQLSTYLSKEAISKIISLINNYKSQYNTYAPQISKLANDLYQIQHKYSDLRGELQKKIVTNTLFSIVKIQLLIRDATKILNLNIIENINLIKNNELQLSLVADLPLLFGIWLITVLGSIKYGLSIKKLARKANEVLEMLNFIEKKSKTRWLNDFIEGIGAEKVDLMFLNKIEYKNKFITENLSQFQLISTDEYEKKLNPPVVKRQSSDSYTYLSSFNKVLQNFNSLNKGNNYLNNNNDLDKNQIGIDLEYNELLKRSYVSYFEGLITSISLKDVLNYLKRLEVVDYDPKLLKELENYIKGIGININGGVNNIQIRDGMMNVKSNNMEDLGTFDFEDRHFVKIFKNFIKGFETDGITIEIKLKNSTTEESDPDMGLITIYEERIQKLENLLHENKFQNFNNRWSQLDNKIMKIDNFETIENLNDMEEQIINSSKGILGRKTTKLPPHHYLEKIIRLEEQNKLLREEIEEYKKCQTIEEVERLKKSINSKEIQMKSYQATIKDLVKTIEDKDALMNSLQKEIEGLKNDKQKEANENKRLNSCITELNVLNKDLLENMSNKEVELQNENQINQKEKNDLKLRIEALLDIKSQYDKVISIVRNTGENIKNTLVIMSSLIVKSKDLTNIVYYDMETFCLILEIMGLLLTKEQDKIEIKRVKGLKHSKREIYLKKNNINDNEQDVTIDDDKLFFEIIVSNVVKDLKNEIQWEPNMDNKIKELKDSLVVKNSSHNEEDNDSDSNEKMHTKKIKEIEEIAKSLTTYDLKLKSFVDKYYENETEIKFNEFVKRIKIERLFILDRIHKRFEDVESLARKLQKEKVQLKNDLKNANKKISQQLALRNFQENDLVLFLKTLTPVLELQSVNGIDNIDDNSKTNNNKQPWAIFNIGSPNYYLKNKSVASMKKLNEKEWFVGRINNIEEYVITSENKDNISENPFNLALGTKWYLVETKEESIF